MSFLLSESHQCSAPPDWVIATCNSKILSPTHRSWHPLSFHDFQKLDVKIVQQHYLGELNDGHCFVVEIESDQHVSDLHYVWSGLRSLLGLVDDELFQLAGRALQIINWSNHHQYCGRCGGTTREAKSDRARVCNRCQLRFYPRISPCVICLVIRENTCLLARSAKHPAKMFSTLAGFVEPGESVEQTLRREIMEEVNVKIKNIRYFGSQPWPFPGQLMLGFFADYHSGEIQTDGIEILEANWFQIENFPQIPPQSTISGRLISHFVGLSEQVGGARS